MYIYETYFEEIICKLKEEGKILRNLSHNFHNSNIYDAWEDIARLCSYLTDICNWNIRHILLKNASRSRPQASPKTTEGTLLFHLHLKSVFLRDFNKSKTFFNNEYFVDIMSKNVSWAKCIETEHWLHNSQTCYNMLFSGKKNMYEKHFS